MKDLLTECLSVIDIEISQLQKVRDSIDQQIVAAIHAIHACKGKTVVCGIGKAGLVCQKIAATMSSLGIPSFFLHPAEALHGDLGCLTKEDVVLLISNSGSSQEILRLLPALKFIGNKTIAVTSNPQSEMALHCDIAVCIPKLQEACALNLAPTSSTTAEMVIGDAIAVVVSSLRGFNREKYALNHPAGALGSKLLTRVKDLMKTGDDLPIVENHVMVKDAIIEISKKGLGAAIVVNPARMMCGIVTDGDLRRALEKNMDLYNTEVAAIMTPDPIYVEPDKLAVEALQIMEKGKRIVSMLPVLDNLKNPIGIIHNHYIIRSGIML